MQKVPSDLASPTPESAAAPAVQGNLSILLPAHNEAETIERVLSGFREEIALPAGAELIVCEDGSTDGTDRLLRDLAKRQPFRLVTDARRKGYGDAVKDGLSHVKTPYVLFSDSDGQYDPRDFWDLRERMDGADMVIGVKTQRQEAPHRIVLSKGFHLLIKLLFGVRLRDIDCGFRLIRKEFVEDVLREVHDLPYSFWAEFTIVASLKGIRIAEVPVSHRSRLYGNTTIYQPRRLPGILLLQMRGLLRLRRRMRSLVAHPSQT